MISKTDFIRSNQCKKLFWYKKNNYPESNKNDESASERIDIGNQVGEISKKLFPGGVEIPFMPGKYKEMFDLTIEQIKLGVNVIYEASFIHDGVFIRVDLMKKSQKGWDIYEVKSSSKVKSQHKLDASMQWNVLKSIDNIKLNSVSLLVINKNFKIGSETQVDNFFNFKDITNYANKNKEEILDKLKELKEISNQDSEPDIKIGSHCNKPHHCIYFDRCWPKNIKDKNSIFNLYNYNLGKKAELFEEGIDTINKIPSNSLDHKIQKIQLKANKINKPFVDKKKIKEFIKKVKYPISYFDFETFSDAVPIFEEQLPYMQIPFQYSLHIQKTKNDKFDIHENHYEFLADPDKDPRRHIAKTMLEHLPAKGTIMAFNMSFEKKCIENLAEFCPDLSEDLQGINERFVDLIEPFRGGGYYDINFKGSFSLKSVLPVFTDKNPDYDYLNLDINNGGQASMLFKDARNKPTTKQVESLNKLYEYCRLDTYGMYLIFKKLIQE